LGTVQEIEKRSKKLKELLEKNKMK